MKPVTSAALLWKWLLGLVYLGLSFLLVWLLPLWLRLPLLAIFILYFAWQYLTAETAAGRAMNLRPLTRWDVPADPHFLDRLESAAREAGLRRPPVFAVADDEWVNAYAVGGRQGLVVFTTEILKRLPPDELLAVAGHELQHLAGQDSMPALIGGSLMAVIGQLARLLQSSADAAHGNWVAGILGLLGLAIDLCLWAVGWVAEAFLAKRSRIQEHLADLAGARLTSTTSMINALSRLEEIHPSRKPSGGRWSSAWIAQRLHASHPPTPERIAYLQQAVERGEVHA